MMRVRLILSIAGATLLAASPAAAQSRGDGVPPGFRPPPGMCRIWLDDVPPGQQPAPTTCPVAVRNRPSNGRVIFGDEVKDKAKRFGTDVLRRDKDGVWERKPDRKGDTKDARKPDERKRDDRKRGERKPDDGA